MTADAGNGRRARRVAPAGAPSSPHRAGPAGTPKARRRRREIVSRGLAGLRRARRRGRAVWLILSAALLVVATALAAGAAVYAHYAQDLPSIEGFGTGSLSQVTRIFASDGKTLLTEHYANQENRTVVDLAHISIPVQDATIAVEDKDFYSHNGVDPVRILGAVIYDMTHRQAAQGASTITQQVVKTAVLKAPERSFSRKVKELILATQLDARYSKREILSMYLNDNNYSNSTYGIEAAAQLYFHTHANALSLPEASFLAGIPNSPSYYDPLTEAGYRRARERQRVVLDAMVRNGYVTARQADAAFAKDLQAEIRAPTQAAAQQQSLVAPHFADYALDELRKRYGDDYVNRAGLTVVTTLDPHAQDLLESAVRTEVKNSPNHVQGPDHEVVDGPDGRSQVVPVYPANNGAAIVISPQTGAVLAMVGSYDYRDHTIQGDSNNTLGSQINADGQPNGVYHFVGSTFKGYVYATALANGYTPSSTLDDSGCAAPEIHYCPTDWDAPRQLGQISLARSIQLSRNKSSVRLLDAVGVPRVLAVAEALGVPSGSLYNHGLTATLGVEHMAMIDHVAAYAAFANGGRRVHPWVLAKITDNRGNVILDQKTPVMEQAIPAHVALEMADILKGAERPDGWSLSIPFGNKSGTTEAYHDSYFVGFSTDLAIGAWMGNNDGPRQRYLHGLFGENGAGLILRDFVRDWYAGRSPKDFAAAPESGDPCRARPSAPASPSPSPSPSASASGGVPRAPYQYGASQPTPSPQVPLSVLCPSPSPGSTPVVVPGPTPSGPGGQGTPPASPIIDEPSPSPTPTPARRPTPCTLLPPFC